MLVPQGQDTEGVCNCPTEENTEDWADLDLNISYFDPWEAQLQSMSEFKMAALMADQLL